MEEATVNMFTNMAINLSELALKGTATAIHTKIQSVKNEKNIESIRNAYMR